MQPSHCTSDMRWMKERIGDHRTHRISRWKTFADLGLPVPGGSDCPIEDGNPLFDEISMDTVIDSLNRTKELRAKNRRIKIIFTQQIFVDGLERYENTGK